MSPCTSLDYLKTEKNKTRNCCYARMKTGQRSQHPRWQPLMGLGAFVCLDHSEVSVCKCHGGPGSSSPVETCRSTCLSATFCRLIAFSQLGAELNDALVPVFRQQKHEETQADDEHSDQAHRVKINITCVEVHHCKITYHNITSLII